MNLQQRLGRTFFRTAVIVVMPVVAVLCAFLWILAQLANPEA
jgi:hypothetical protein